MCVAVSVCACACVKTTGICEELANEQISIDSCLTHWLLSALFYVLFCIHWHLRCLCKSVPTLFYLDPPTVQILALPLTITLAILINPGDQGWLVIEPGLHM